MSDRAAQEAFVGAFHDRWPGVTARDFADGRGPDGRSSYQVLADLCAPGQRVLDLGAGDGHLLALVHARGVAIAATCALDLSAGELRAVGARSPGVPRVQARAQALPLAAGSFDLVLSHLAFTLMAEPELVVAEVARVLGPGGRFAAVVGGGPRGDDAFAGLLDLAAARLRGRPPVAPRQGDRRARSDDGLAALLSPAHGFVDLRLDDLPIDLSGSPDDVWARLASSYELAMLPGIDLAALRADFVAAAPRWRRADGAIACTMATRLVVATRAG